MTSPWSFGSARLPSLVTIAQLLLVTSTLALETQDGLRIDVTRPVECARKTRTGDFVSVHYKGTLDDGTVFDTSYTRGNPIKFPLGAGMVIKGWDQGLLDMCIGEARLLVIPPELAYGNRASGPIPAGSTLTFATELVAIEGVEAPAQAPEHDAHNAHESQDLHESTDNTVDANKEKKPSDDSNGECKLLGPFALIVQGALGLLALVSLVFKRYRESPQRPLKVWFFDVSKQVFGSALLHVFNVFMSILSSGALQLSNQRAAAVASTGSNWEPNPCSFYLINIAVDTTLGVPILFMILKVLHRAAALTPLANPPESIKTGHYGQPPNAVWWLKQSFLYFLGLLLMKGCVFALFEILPVIVWVGNWALRWTEGNEALQIAFVMFLFPLIANSVQYYIIDGFIKDGSSGHEAVAGHDSDDDDDEYRQPLQPELDASFDDRGVLRAAVLDKDDDEEDRRRR